ncbi:hypothetical protein EN829_035505 [Mesorhizobium sp. M00.F.Ca.ET.186.01.1.1]|nr:hypothetical protein EN829_035505 [Mesorhizobium sp. M00.F.Ca.ET.186.01.1.1]
MKRFGTWAGRAAGVGIALLLTACNNQAAPQEPARTQTVHPAGMGETVIPSVDRDKKLTTNSHGTTFSGMGHGLYSSIGSSHLHSGGPSTKLEAQLGAAGVHGVQALIVGDWVFLAPTTANQTSINSIDPMQAHLLGSYTGSSSRGNDTPSGLAGQQARNNTTGVLGTSDRSALFAQARTVVERSYGTDAQVWTVSSKKGIDALEKVKKHLRDKKGDNKMADELDKLFREAKR